MTTPPVCVLMPVYNVEPYLDASIQSVLAQTFTDYEFVIVDDGSKDQTRAVAEKHAAQDRRIRVISRPNTGIVGAIEDGLAASSAPWIARLDGDDTAAQRLALQMEYIRTHPQCVAVGSSVILTDPWGGDVCEMHLPAEHEEIDAALLQGRNEAMTHGGVTLSRAAIRAIGGYRREFDTAEDLDLFLRFAEHGRLGNLPQCLLRYRQHMRSTSHVQVQKQQRLVQEALRQAYVRRGLGVPEDLEARVRLYRSESLATFHRDMSHWAFNAGNIATARRNALVALRLEPVSGRSWWTLARAGLGRSIHLARRWRGASRREP